MPEVNRRYFDALMLDKGVSLRGLAQEMEMTHSQLSLTFSGSRKMQIDEAIKIANIFGEPLLRVIEHSGAATKAVTGRRVPVVGAVQGDGTIKLSKSKELAVPPTEMADGMIAIQFRTADSALSWMDGWVVFCREPTDINAGAMSRLCYVQIEKGPQAIACVKRGYQDGTFNLSGPYHADNVALVWASPIVLTRN